MPKTLRILIVALLLDLGSNGTAFPALATSEAGQNSSLRVRFQKGLVSIEASEAPWVPLLADLSRKSGIVFHIRVPIEGAVTALFDDLPLERALRHLFGRDADFMFVYGKQGSRCPSLGLSSELAAGVWWVWNGPAGSRFQDRGEKLL